MLIFNQQALNELKSCKEKIDTSVPKKIQDELWFAGLSPKAWFNKFEPGYDFPELPEKRLNRSELLDFIQPYRGNNEVDEITIRKLIVCIFAWGGMRPTPRWGQLAINTIKSYEKICLGLLRGELDATSAYDEFYKQKKLGQMRGVGPAYYTKLIFFFGNQAGAIMDRWTARSTNLLLNAPVVKLNSTKYVDNENPTQVYAKYLEFISELKTTLGIESVSKTEELIFSCSHIQATVINRLGKHHQACSAWRKYVVENT